MHYRKPQYYHKFTCTADKCQDTCCAGWQILIDKDSLEYYSSVKGEFGTRLLNSIDWCEGAFEQYNRRCSFLNEKNLCDIYGELGEKALCQTCRQYPRHVEEFEDLRELSLSLSCPEAAGIILGEKEPLRLLEEEDDQEEIEEDYEEFDFLLFNRLEEARTLIFQILQDRNRTLKQRMVQILEIADTLEKALNQGLLFEVELEKISADLTEKDKQIPSEIRYEAMKNMLKDLKKLEILREEWYGRLENLDGKLYSKGAAFYQESRATFEEAIRESGSMAQWEIYGEQLLGFFLYTYFSGAVYDEMIYTKAVLAVFSVLWIQELALTGWVESGLLPALENLVEYSYQYAREIEHSDENLILLEEMFDTFTRYEKEQLSEVILG